MDLAIWHVSIDLIGAGVATVLANTQVVFVGIVAWAVLRERPTTAALVAVPVVLVGVALLSGLGESNAYGDDPVLGAILGVTTGITYAVFILVLRSATSGHGAGPTGPLLDATAGLVIGSAMLSVFDGAASWQWSWPAHGWLILLAVVSQTVGWLLISYALPRLPALETSLMLLLQPAAALMWAGLIFSERPSSLQWTGVVIVLCGVVIATARGATVRRSAAADSPAP